MQSHHALLARFSGAAEPHVDQLLRDHFFVDRKNNPDVQVLVRDVFTIEDSRALYERASMTPILLENVLVCLCGDITEEAQQALLKLMEEPQRKSKFLMLVHRSTRLLPTLLSRFHIVTPEASALDHASSEGASFLAGTPAERLRTVAELVQDVPHAVIDEFLDGVELLLYSRGAAPGILREVLFVRARINLRGAPKKQLLEHLACTLPQLG